MNGLSGFRRQGSSWHCSSRCLWLRLAALTPRPHRRQHADESFRQLAGEILDFVYRSDPSTATYVGIHDYDDKIADRSAAAVHAASDTAREFRSRLDDVDEQDLSPEAQLDLAGRKSAMTSR
ncbi:hypothetical protein JRC04_02290 [Mycolicibacterium sp. S2-37]|uniref:hypothetical protein n=1 Tax=Mycolicibacterium sp. S2-37 TaxID=2810297 RepID=UPI001A94F378|nr:hypothetical protein [Mycolicibacterium sp. S2-37]MBO0676288.1 hypothetical protein [Mycolicibacterium sp. S2-37]